MAGQAVFIDLSNFYNGLVRSKLTTDHKFLQDYFLNWLDFDLLANKLTSSNSFPDIWVFYSGGRIGSKEARINDEPLRNYM